jgi:hypothetical protein
MKSPIIAAIIFALIFGTVWFSMAHHRSGEGNTGAAPAAPKPVPIVQTPGVEVQYVNTSLKFSFTVPDGVLAQEFPGTSGIVVRLHDADGANHLAVFAAAGKSDPAVFTAEQVAKDAPGMSVTDAETHEMPGGVTALEFTSDSKTWGGPSRELWFAYNGTRYQASVPLADAKLLDFVRDHWQWRK